MKQAMPQVVCMAFSYKNENECNRNKWIKIS